MIEEMPLAAHGFGNLCPFPYDHDNELTGYSYKTYEQPGMTTFFFSASCPSSSHVYLDVLQVYASLPRHLHTCIHVTVDKLPDLERA